MGDGRRCDGWKHRDVDLPSFLAVRLQSRVWLRRSLPYRSVLWIGGAARLDAGTTPITAINLIRETLASIILVVAV